MQKNRIKHLVCTGMFLFAIILFSGCSAEKSEPYVQLLSTRETYSFGDTIALQVSIPEFKLSEARNYAYSLWVKTEEDDWVREIENEPILNFFIDENIVYLQVPEYEFKQPGYIDVQIDIINEKTNVTTQLYVDQFKVFPTISQYPTKGTYYPRRLTFSVGEELKIYGHIPLSPDEKVSSFEYSLYVKNKQEGHDWEQIVPYTSFEDMEDIDKLMNGGINDLFYACSFVFEDTGLYALQLNVRKISAGIDEQFWLGEFSVTDKERVAYKGIIRQILPAYDNIDDFDALYELISHDIFLASRYMYHNYMDNLEEYKTWVTETFPADEVRVENGSIYFTEKAFTNLQEINMQTGTLIYSIGTVELDLYNRPAEEFVLQQLKNEDIDLAVMALVNHFLYSNYDYAISLKSPEVHDLRFPSAECIQYARDMYMFAQSAGFEAKWISTANEYGSSVHAVCQILINDKWYSFDPTTNVVYKSEVEKIDSDTPYIELFQNKDLDYLVGDRYWKNVKIYDIITETSSIG